MLEKKGKRAIKLTIICVVDAMGNTEKLERVELEGEKNI